MTAAQKTKPIVLLDLDNTILDFDMAEKTALSRAFTEMGVPYDDALLKRYNQINIRHWEMLEDGVLTRDQVLVKRFEALYREAAEELGLTAFNPVFLETNVWETERDREFVFIFAAVGHPDLAPDNDEVTEGRWWTQAELTAAIGKDLLTPNFEAEYARIQGRLLALL